MSQPLTQTGRRRCDELNHPHYAPTPSRGRRRCTVTIDETIPPVVVATDCVNPAYKPAKRSERAPGVMERLSAALAAVRDVAVWDALTVEEQAENGAWLINRAPFWNKLTIFEKARAGSHFAQWQPHVDERDGVESSYTLRSPRSGQSYTVEFDSSRVGMVCNCPAGRRGDTCYHVVMFPGEWLSDMMGELSALMDWEHETSLYDKEREAFAYEAMQYGSGVVHATEPMRQLLNAADWG